MAVRPVFIPADSKGLARSEYTEFQFYSGFSDAQKKRCIQSLHQSFLRRHPQWRLLEISSHSPVEAGVKLSAFHLPIRLKNGREVPVECAFQAGKVFQKGGPYLDLLEGSPKAAKRDPRLKESGGVIGFVFEGERFPTVPKTCFYHFLYLKGLTQHPELGDVLMEYDGFTDIVFNPEKSLNCQAQAAALYVSLRRAGLLEQAMESVASFIRTVYQTNYTLPPERITRPEPAEPAAQPVSVDLQPGERIRHPSYGEGDILEVRNTGAVLTVRFACGEKKLSGVWVSQNCTRME